MAGSPEMGFSFPLINVQQPPPVKISETEAFQHMSAIQKRRIRNRKKKEDEARQQQLN